MSDFDKVAALLTAEAPEQQVAAAIILGELGVKRPAVHKGLTAMLASDVAPLQRHALDALRKIGLGDNLERVLELTAARDDEVRDAAVQALLTLGARVIPLVRKRLTTASPRARQALDAVLARLGGKEAFSAILGSLHDAGDEAAKAVALEVRRHVKDAPPKVRRAYATQVERFLKLKATAGNVVAQATAMKILGFLEDPAALTTLLDFATDTKVDQSVRAEALAALRFVTPGKGQEAKVNGALLRLAEGEDAELARAALFTLVSRELPEGVVKVFARLASHKDLERARFAIDFLGQQDAAAAVRALVEVVTTQDRVRAELAAEALKRHGHAAALLAKALADTRDPERARIIHKALRPHARLLGKADRAELLRRAVDLLAAGHDSAELLLQVAREANPEAAADGLRELAEKLGRGKTPETALLVLRVLCRTEQAKPADRLRLAVLELGAGRNDTHPAARSRDAALKTLEQLLRDGFDVSRALLADKTLSPETRYYVGFHFVELGHPLGEDLLTAVAAGRSKLAKMAKNKLALALNQA